MRAYAGFGAEVAVPTVITDGIALLAILLAAASPTNFNWSVAAPKFALILFMVSLYEFTPLVMNF